MKRVNRKSGYKSIIMIRGPDEDMCYRVIKVKRWEKNYEREFKENWK